jgi:hypothetical protein
MLHICRVLINISKQKNLFIFVLAEVGKVTRFCNGATNYQLLFFVNPITSYKSSEFKPVKTISPLQKQSSKTLQSYKSRKAITLLCVKRCMSLLSPHIQKDHKTKRNSLSILLIETRRRKQRILDDMDDFICNTFLRHG